MSHSATHLLRSKRFLPLFLTQALGAFNDNLYKQALFMLIAYQLAMHVGIGSGTLTSLATALFMLPYFLFSATAGQLADKFEKSDLIRKVKLAEIGIMAMGALALLIGNLWVLLFIIFLLGIQATFFGPLKYGILPDHLEESELVPGNGMIEAATFLMIVMGTILGGELILFDSGAWIVSGGLIAVAIMGWMASRDIPTAPPAEPDLVLDRNIWRETLKIIGFAKQNRRVFRSIIGISWFWLVGAILLAQIPTFAKEVLAADHNAATLLLAVVAIGIGIGSFLSSKLLKDRIEATYVPIAALLLAMFMGDLYFASRGFHASGFSEAPLMGFTEFLSSFAHWRIIIDILGVAISAGVYAVPLYTIMQALSPRNQRSRTIAANNVLNACFMVVGSLIVMALFNFGVTIPGIFGILAIANAGVAIYICTLLPDTVIKFLMRHLLKLTYRVEVKGLENYAKAGSRVLIVANHVSFLDAALISCFLPERITFAVNSKVAGLWWMRPFMALVDAFPLDPTNPLATKALIERLRQNHKIMVFPEGRITLTGSMMKIYPGPGMIADKSDAMILPIRVDGAKYTHFSRLKGRQKLRFFPKIRLTLLPPQKLHADPAIKGRARRALLGTKLYDLMSDMHFQSDDLNKTLFQALLDAMDQHGGRHLILEDIQRKPISYRRLLAGSFALACEIAPDTSHGEAVGILLPNAIGTVTAFIALHAIGRVPAMLNYSTGARNMILGCQAAQIRTVYTSRRFLSMGKLEAAATAIEQSGITLRYLEDLRESITPKKKYRALFMAFQPRKHYEQLLSETGAEARYTMPVETPASPKSWVAQQVSEITGIFRRKPKPAKQVIPSPDTPAVILFTSGSEGTPKGVALSHRNLLANRFQLGARIDFGPQDVMFNALPIFHAFGLTGGTLLPLSAGVRSFLYPSPLHYRLVPELIYDTNATIFFSTDTFLNGYARFAHPYDFYKIRYIFSGAERVKDETHQAYAEKFGLRILEGYGTTETSPGIAINTAMQNRAGSVGRILPGITAHFQPVEGIENGGRLYVSGPNIMLGYLKSEHPGQLEKPEVNAHSPYPWHDTGDIAELDEAGYLYIRGRAKRFAKIAGEMVSLTAVEQAASMVWPGHQHAVIHLPDPRKGEQLILVTDKPNASREELQTHTREHGLSEIMLPRTILSIDAVPVLGTGKTDYVSVKQWVEKELG